VADGIVLERQGIQTASIVTDAFTRSGNAMAKTMGAEGYRYAMVPHPVSNLDAQQCLERARAVLPDVLTILGVGDGNVRRRRRPSRARPRRPRTARRRPRST
jgi:hypothetical protein